MNILPYLQKCQDKINRENMEKMQQSKKSFRNMVSVIKMI